MSNFGIKQAEDIQKKLDYLDEEVASINLCGKKEKSLTFRLHHLCGRKEALQWVMGRQII